MKKYSKLVFMLCLFFVGINFVSAKELLATCSYTSDIMDFTIKVYDNGKLEYSPEADFMTDKNGGQIWFGYNNLSKKSYFKKIYSDNKLSANCPDVSYCTDSGNVYIADSNEICGNGEAGILVSGTMKKESSNVEQKTDKSKTYCTKYLSTRTDSLQKSITFGLDADGNKIFKIVNNNNTSQGGTANYDGVVYLSSRSYSVDPDSVDLYWSDNTCKTTPLFQKYYNGAFEHVVITSEKADDWQNASIDGTDGFEEDNTTQTSKDSGRYSPGKICGKDGENCNVSLATFCTNAKVARILKGVGTLIVIAKILVPAIIILMGFVNLFKIITAGKEDEARKYAKSIITKVIIGVIIFLLPGLINFVFDIANNIIASSNEYQSEFTNCEKCILDIGECNINGN